MSLSYELLASLIYLLLIFKVLFFVPDNYYGHRVLALLLALVSRRNERQVKVPMFEALYLSRGIVHNVGA